VVVLEGEIDLLLDDGDVRLKAGDVVVQQASTTPGSIAAPSSAAWRWCSSMPKSRPG
jgi:uncharacterized cupin superfamily protein